MIENYIVLSILVVLFYFCKSRQLITLIIIYYLSYIVLSTSQYGIQFDSIIYTTFDYWNAAYLHTMSFTFIFFIYAAILYVKHKRISSLLYAGWLIIMMALDGLMSLTMAIDSNLFITCYNAIQNSNLVIDIMFAVFGSQNGIKAFVNRSLCRHDVIRGVFNRFNDYRGS